MATTVLAGSLGAAAQWLAGVGSATESDLVLVTTAAAFTGATEAAVRAADALSPLGARVEALMVATRDDAADPYFARRVREADLVVALDGAALHARAVWRDTDLGRALEAAARLVALGDVASALFEVMIDPRGGAPTTGLGYRRGICVTTAASAERLARTRALLGEAATLVVLGPSGVVVGEDATWRAAAGDVEVTVGDGPGSL